MIVYVESNFVLEMALEQEQFLAANEILSLAENKKITLAFPGLVLSEPFESISRERRERNVLISSLRRTLENLRRSEPHKRIMLDLEPMINALRSAHLRQIDLLQSTFERLLAVGECIEIKVSDFRDALIYQKNLVLSPQDSIIYSAIVTDIDRRSEEEEKCFLTRDRRAFDNSDDRDIKATLASKNCRYIGSFIQGLDYINHALQKTE